MSKCISQQKGLGLISVILSITIFSILTVSITSWYILTKQKQNSINEDLYELSIVEDRLISIRNLPSNEIKDKCKNNYKINEKYKNYILKEEYYRDINSSHDIDNKVKITISNNTNNKKYSIDKIIFSEKEKLFNPNLYVENLTYPNHSISIKYDKENKRIQYYIDGNEFNNNAENSFEEGNGYARFDNGFIIQWGKTNTNKIVFTKPFPHNCFNIISTVSAINVPSYVYSFNKYQAEIETYGKTTYWSALGY